MPLFSAEPSGRKTLRPKRVKGSKRNCCGHSGGCWGWGGGQFRSSKSWKAQTVGNEDSDSQRTPEGLKSGEGESSHTLVFFFPHFWALKFLRPLSLFEGHLLSTRGIQGSEIGGPHRDEPYFLCFSHCLPRFLSPHTQGPQNSLPPPFSRFPAERWPLPW